MCGIVGYVGDKSAAAILLEGLKNLEYRGYDSAGIAVLDAAKNSIFLFKKEGKLSSLTNGLSGREITGGLGIGHTRWATHGEPNEANAHPHYGNTRDFMVVHNGIIENHQELKSKLIKEKHVFTSQTDTEVIAHLIEKFYKGDLKKAVLSTVKCLRGSFAIGVISIYHPGILVAAR
ncbi:MAG: class II glutamine amidotransferase, partial [Candidatus Omnitrophica bacterium]|nr:class II glutamine amidotransferase [Candidatus Omnitrophota bacterium]